LKVKESVPFVQNVDASEITAELDSTILIFTQQDKTWLSFNIQDSKKDFKNIRTDSLSVLTLSAGRQERHLAV